MYSDNLGKELPRIPRMKTSTSFWAFVAAGRALGSLHVGYETVPEYSGVTVSGPTDPTRSQLRMLISGMLDQAFADASIRKVEPIVRNAIAETRRRVKSAELQAPIPVQVEF